MRYFKCTLQAEEAHKRYQTCMDTLKELGRVYWHANFYYRLFRFAAPSKSGILSTPRQPLKKTKRHQSARDKIELEQDQHKRTALKTPGPPNRSSAVYPVHYSNQQSSFAVTASAPESGICDQAEVTNGTRILTGSISHVDLDIETDRSNQDFEETQITGAGSQISSLYDWLNDDALFSSLFPSA